MGTKTHPGNFDCHAKALPDEPLFVVLGRDMSGPRTVERWCDLRLHMIQTGKAPASDMSLIEEARACISSMQTWRSANVNGPNGIPTWREPRPDLEDIRPIRVSPALGEPYIPAHAGRPDPALVLRYMHEMTRTTEEDVSHYEENMLSFVEAVSNPDMTLRLIGMAGFAAFVEWHDEQIAADPYAAFARKVEIVIESGKPPAVVHETATSFAQWLHERISVVDGAPGALADKLESIIIGTNETTALAIRAGDLRRALRDAFRNGKTVTRETPPPVKLVETVRKVTMGLRQVAANLILRGQRELPYEPSEEHGFDLEAMPQYADRIMGYARELEVDSRQPGATGFADEITNKRLRCHMALHKISPVEAMAILCKHLGDARCYDAIDCCEDVLILGLIAAEAERVVQETAAANGDGRGVEP